MVGLDLVAGVFSHNGCPIHYWVGGNAEGPTIGFTHGAAMDHQLFDAQIPAVADRYRVVIWDVRGHGQSRPGPGFGVSASAEDLVALMDRIGIRQAVLVGQSMGGNISQEVVWRYPERVTALVIVESACNTLPIGPMDRWLLRFFAGPWPAPAGATLLPPDISTNAAA